MRKSLFKENSFVDYNVWKDTSRILLNDKDKVIGIMIAKRWQENLPVKLDKNHGFIQAILVHKDYRNQGIRTSLLNHAEKDFKQKGMTKIFLGSDLLHYFPGLPSEYPQLAKV